ncbi:hypothetical protein KFK09_009533 [Dendrobium nobile]|uniref:Uncharacterized protein n=1 Tax=Dendrobium nobile TaxID=94219 RepID=A0A8T3BL66_DENNO|nr:hypothetical protein KFK09_009533 [Dendrobium nobile]
MPNNPLQCWDEINMCRIASMVGKPYMIDGNSFQWSRREFARICVCINLDSKLPLGVWVEGSSKKFFQRIEYEKIPNFCFCYGKIGHLRDQCQEKIVKLLQPVKNNNLNSNANSAQEEGLIKEVVSNEADYGPWIHVNFRRNKFRNQVPRINSQNNSNVQTSNFKIQAKNSMVYRKVEKTIVENEGRQALELNYVNVSMEERIEKSGDAPASIIHQNEENASSSMDSFLPAISLDNNKFKLLSDEFEEGEIVIPSKEDLSKFCGNINFMNHSSSMVGCGNEGKLEEVKRIKLKKERGARKRRDSLYLKEFVKENGVFLWKSNMTTFSVLESSSQFIVGEIDVQNKGSSRIATIHGSTDVYKRRKLWGKLQLYSIEDKDLIIGGDFNCLLNKNEKRGGKRFVYSLGAKEMESFLVSNDLHEVRCIRPKYTWCNYKIGADRILKRLDRCYLDSVSFSSPHRLVVRHLAKISSDHCPLILNMLNCNPILKKTIKYEDVWISNRASFEVVKKVWSRKIVGDFSQILNCKLQRTLKALYYWSKDKHKVITQRKECLSKEILELQEKKAKKDSRIMIA